MAVTWEIEITVHLQGAFRLHHLKMTGRRITFAMEIGLSRNL